jgi:hypothetical protein
MPETKTCLKYWKWNHSLGLTRFRRQLSPREEYSSPLTFHHTLEERCIHYTNMNDDASDWEEAEDDDQTGFRQLPVELLRLLQEIKPLTLRSFRRAFYPLLSHKAHCAITAGTWEHVFRPFSECQGGNLNKFQSSLDTLSLGPVYLEGAGFILELSLNLTRMKSLTLPYCEGSREILEVNPTRDSKGEKSPLNHGDRM